MDEFLTVGRLRELIADLPDTTPVCPCWSEIPGDTDPGVSFDGAAIDTRSEGVVLTILVSLFYLD